MTKQIFLETGYFISNEYLDEYLKLIEMPFSFSGYYEEHHVIPVSVYKYRYKCKDRKTAEREYADKDVNNYKIRLLFKEHIKAHWLLYHCTVGPVKAVNGRAFLRMTAKLKLDPAQLIDEAALNYIQQLKDELINSDPNYWSEENLIWLKNNYLKFTAKDYAKQLNKSIDAVINKVNRLGLKKRAYSAKLQQKWTEAEIDYLKQNYEKFSTAELAKYLNRTENSISTKIQVLKLASKREKNICIYCPELGMTWSSYADASRATGIAQQHIYRAVKESKSHITHGLTFIKK